ncbi:MAG: NUDIX domain-containing protein [Pseudomonadota bacterium]
MQGEVASGFGKNDVEILETVNCYTGFMRIDRVRLKCRLFQGGWSKEFSREVLRRDPGVGVLLYDPHLDKVLLVEQFRIGCLNDARNGPWALELVAGLLDEEGEAPGDVAIRETFEETGLQVNGLLPICEYYNSPGGSAEKMTVYCASFDSTKAGGIFGLQTESENIRSVVVSRIEAQQAVAGGRINNAMSIIALQWLQLTLETTKAALLAQQDAGGPQHSSRTKADFRS